VTRASALGRYPSPLRYPGGKGKVANYVKILMLENDLVGLEYVEPYAGGASVALGLLFEEYASHIHINDLNPGVHAFWDAALNHTDELCKRVRDTPVSIDTWHAQRAVVADPDAGPVKLGFATFFLNRVNRSGIISGGVIGGLDQTGPYKIDARYNVDELVRRIAKVGRYRSRITLTGDDAVALLKRWQDPAAERAFIYLDPPYFVKGRGLYDNFYGPDDHAAVAAEMRTLPHPWIVSYDAVPEILSLYEGHARLRYSLAYSAASTPSQGPEVMFFSPDLEQPDAGRLGPAGISITSVQRVAAARRDRPSAAQAPAAG